ncbi:MAG TPA: type 4a pilus biogenesis protein PilO [Gaiellaceae bacterium]|nr:type 4a pilus biogenesis protein PilO [Gaiellaceae bacterium]
MKPKKPLPKWAPLAGIVVAALVVGAGGWKFVVSPQNKKAASLQQQTAGVRQQIAQNLAAAAAARNTSAAKPQQVRVADLYKLAKAMPSHDDIPDLLIELSNVTKQAGVQVTTLSPNPSSPSTTTGGPATIPISLNVTGDFFSVTDLLYRLRNLVWVRNGALEATGRLFSIDSVNLTPTTGKTVTATISLHAFVYGGGAAPAATPAPAAAPVSTDTTVTTTTTTDTSSGGPSAAGAP